MPVLAHRLSRLALAALAIGALGACSTIGDQTRRLASAITPYKAQVVQGNFVSREQVEALRVGMNRQQVQSVLGTPLVTSLFHAERWDYVFTLKRQGVAPQARRLTVFFKNDQLERFEGDTMPSEAEFVATLDVKSRGGAVPALEASPDRLRQLAGSGAPAAQPQAQPEAPLVNYPPLEPPAR